MGEGQGGYLDFGHDGPSFRAGAGKCGQRRRGHQGAGPGKAAEVTAGDVILLVPHDDGVHDKEASPWQPESVLLGDEWRTLKVQGYGYAPIGHQVKTGTQTFTMSARMNVVSHKNEDGLFFPHIGIISMPISNACNLCCFVD